MPRFLYSPGDFKPDLELRSLEYQLRRSRPYARRDLIARIEAAQRPEPRARMRVAVAGAMTVALLGALASVGGVSYAATAVTHAAQSVRRVLVTHTTFTPLKVDAGSDQYRPGYGFGDPNHNHSGPPGLTDGRPGQKAPPSQVAETSDGLAYLVYATISVDEQAALYFSVLAPDGEQLLLTQNGSSIGGGVEGPQTKTIHYVMLVPRTLPLQLRVPANLLVQGQTYTIRVIAVDPQGNKSTVFVKFTA